MNVLYIVVPCYNEEEVLPETARRLREKMRALIDGGSISPDSRVLLVNDGSRDRTWEMIRALHEEDMLFDGLCLSRNRGHQNAVLAGLMTARKFADAAISIDADLQDDVNAIDGMVEKWLDGCDIVYGVRSARTTDTAFKRATAEGYYKILNKLGGKVVYNHADYRLMSRRALDALSEYGEVNLFLRGIVPMLGYRTDTVEYERAERFAGESKYPLKKMIALAVDGITSLSVSPLRFVTAAGLGLLALSAALLVVFLVGLCMGYSMLNWKILLFAILFVGGLNMTGLGIVGEYVGKTYFETKHRPRYFISEHLHR